MSETRAWRWSGKKALVTGGSKGLGLAIARALVKRGAVVSIAARDREALETAAKTLGNQVHPLVADMTDVEQARRAIAESAARHGGLDLLVNAVGKSTRGEAATTDPAAFRESYEINMMTAVHGARAALPWLLESHGAIVNVGSLASKAAGRFLGPYPAAKAALALWSQQLRMELGPKGVHTLLVCPGPLKRDDAGARYDDAAADLPAEARRPGAGVKLKGIDVDQLAGWILDAVERKRPELVVPFKARLLFAIAQLFPSWGDWLLGKFTS